MGNRKISSNLFVSPNVSGDSGSDGNKCTIVDAHSVRYGSSGPNPIELQNYKVETLFQPSAYLSGDWYDYWKISDKEIMFYLADVSGHGVTSSLLTSWMAAFHGRSKTPRELIKKLNGMLVQENIEKHITMISGILNIETHELRWSSAGHYPPAIIIEPNQAPRILNTSSFPLGLTECSDSNG